MSTNSKILKNTISVTAVGVLAQVVGFAVPILIAKYFGASSQVDAYYFAIGIPTTIVTMIIGGAIKIIFIPFYQKQKRDNPKLLPDFLGQFFLLLVFLSVGITLLLIFYVHFVGLDFMHSGSTQIYSERFLLISSPIIILSVLFHFVNAIYNANQKFLIIEFTSVLKFGLVILMIYLYHDSHGIESAVYGHILGQILSLIIGVITVKSSGMSMRMSFGFDNNHFKRLISTSALAFGAFVFAQSTPIFQKVIAGLLEEGNLSILGYAERLSIIPSFLIGSSFGVILTTFWSDLRLSKKDNLLSESFNKSLQAMVLIIIPLAFGGMFLSKLLVTVIFERGSFNHEITVSTSIVFTLFLLQIIPSQIQLILSRVLHVFQDMKYLFVFSLIAFFTNSVLMFSLSIYFKMGIIGIPVGLFIGRVIFTTANIIYINKKYVSLNFKDQIICIGKVLLASSIMLGSLIVMKEFFNLKMPNYILLLINVIMGFLVYSVSLRILKHKVFMIIINKILNRIQKG